MKLNQNEFVCFYMHIYILRMCDLIRFPHTNEFSFGEKIRLARLFYSVLNSLEVLRRVMHTSIFYKSELTHWAHPHPVLLIKNFSPDSVSQIETVSPMPFSIYNSPSVPVFHLNHCNLCGLGLRVSDWFVSDIQSRF